MVNILYLRSVEKIGLSQTCFFVNRKKAYGILLIKRRDEFFMTADKNFVRLWQDHH